MARPPTGPSLVDRLPGSDEAKHRTRIILETITGARSIEQAAQALDCNRSYVHALREQILTAAIQGAEARTPGPKSQPPSPEESQAAVIAAERLALDAKVALELERCRTELALVLGPRIGKAPKKKHRRR